MRYLDTYIVSHRHFRCSISYAKRSFHRSINAIFAKLGTLASEEVMELAKRKCMPNLPHGLECPFLNYSGCQSLDFPVIRFLMKLFNLASMDVINDCLLHFKFSLPSELIQERREKFVSKFACCYNHALAIRK